jgi:hypothetical protein
MKAISWERPALVGCLLLVLVSIISCSCDNEPGASSPTATLSPVVAPSPIIPRPTNTPKPIAEPEIDTSLLTDDPCRVPCWHNITPGLSNGSDVRAQLQDGSFVRKDTLKYESTEEAGVPVDLFYWQAKSEHYNRILLRDQVVLRMEIQVDHNWTLGEVVDKFGPPEYVYALIDGEESLGYLVEFFYPALGLEFESATFPIKRADYTSGGKGIVSEKLKVTRAVYFVPTSLEGMLSETYLAPPDAVARYMVDIHEWEGFGKIELAH